DLDELRTRDVALPGELVQEMRLAGDRERGVRVEHQPEERRARAPDADDERRRRHSAVIALSFGKAWSGTGRRKQPPSAAQPWPANRASVSSLPLGLSEKKCRTRASKPR